MWRFLTKLSDVASEAILLPLGGWIPEIIGEQAAKLLFVGAAGVVVGFTLCVLTN